jgi:3-oxoacyl-[acyl-carrier protein] reductase
VDAVLNNAGISYPPTSTVKMTEELYDRVFRINVKSIQLFAQHAVPELKKRGGGSILNTASAAALRPRPGGAAYAASKGAVITFTRALAVELASDNIRVNALAPVAAPTPMVMQQMGLSEAEVIDRLAADIPLGRMCDPADMAASAVFLCSDEASFISGAVLTVDGARSAG